LLKKIGFEVIVSSSSNYSSREKEADTQLTADVVEDVIVKRPSTAKPHEPHGGTVVLLSGDQDMCPLVKKARKYGWHVEIWAYKDTLSAVIKTEAERKEDGTRVTIAALEDHFRNFTHTVSSDWKDGERIPEERTLAVM
jgi:uncharacterized LabA/DUF88 family protein